VSKTGNLSAAETTTALLTERAGGTTIYRHKATGDEKYRKENQHLYDLREP
jgi:hypothetical protein